MVKFDFTDFTGFTDFFTGFAPPIQARSGHDVRGTPKAAFRVGMEPRHHPRLRSVSERLFITLAFSLQNLAFLPPSMFPPAPPKTTKSSHFAILAAKAVFVQLPGRGFDKERNPCEHWSKRLSNTIMSSMFS